MPPSPSIPWIHGGSHALIFFLCACVWNVIRYECPFCLVFSDLGAGVQAGIFAPLCGNPKPLLQSRFHAVELHASVVENNTMGLDLQIFSVQQVANVRLAEKILPGMEDLLPCVLVDPGLSVVRLHNLGQESKTWALTQPGWKHEVERMLFDLLGAQMVAPVSQSSSDNMEVSRVWVGVTQDRGAVDVLVQNHRIFECEVSLGEDFPQACLWCFLLLGLDSPLSLLQGGEWV